MSSKLKKSPCKDCPYRKDAPLQKWDKEEFKKLLNNDDAQFTPNFMCHKKDGCYCTGWVINQLDKGVPCVPLRLVISANRGITKGLDKEVELYESAEEMIEANYPELFEENPRWRELGNDFQNIF